MATSGTNTFDPEFDDILQDAIGMVGGGPILADELMAARRGLDLLLISIQNRNILLHKVETTTVPISASVAFVSLPNSVLDVLTASVRLSTTDMVMDRDGFQRWAEIPNKSQTGRPHRFYFSRQRAGNAFNVWPLPSDTYNLIITVHKSTEDTIRAFENIDVPKRFLPCVVYGLAYWIGLRRHSRVPLDRLQYLKGLYENELTNALREDRERGSFFLRIDRR